MSIREHPAFSVAPLDETAVLSLPCIGISSQTKWRLAVCGALLALLAGWAVLWPQTGDGDAIMHYLNARDGLWQPAKLMGSWARVGAKLHLLLPAQINLLTARWAAAVVSIITAWQTMRLADDLKIRRAILAAPMLILQPMVFTLAGDTMTELPMALGLVIGVRLWWARRWLASCLVMGYLPLMRPEGFFLGILWGLMVVLTPRVGSLPRRSAIALALAAGTVAWFLACWIIRGEPSYFFHDGWSWPADSMRVYGNGSFFAHFLRWPQYCGPILFALFMLGATPFHQPRLAIWTALILLAAMVLPPWWREHVLPWATFPLIAALGWAWRKEKISLPWMAFLLVLTLHSVLWWQGWFASCGLMRILACVSPVTAIVCLLGWNKAADFLQRSEAGPSIRISLGIATIVAMLVTVVVYYVQDPIHYRIFPLHQACAYIRVQNLLAGAPVLVIGDPMAVAELHLPPNPSNLIEHNCERDRECRHLLSAPIGSVGLWDNQHAREWFNVNIQDLPTLGYDVLYESTYSTHCPLAKALGGNNSLPMLRYVVIRKARLGAMVPDLLN